VQNDSRSQQNTSTWGLRKDQRTMGVTVALGTGAYLVVWLVTYLAALIADGHPSVGFLEFHDVLAKTSWVDRHGLAPWRAVGASGGLSHLRFWMAAWVLLVAPPVVVRAVLIRVVGYPAWWLRVRRLLRRGPADGPARFAQLSDIRELIVSKPVPGRIIFGDVGRGRLLAAPDKRSAMVFAPTGGGKTAGFLIPLVMEWDGPQIAVSTKDDILEMTGGLRQKRGNIYIWDVLKKTRWADMRMSWNPLDGCEDYSVALRMARLFAASAKIGDAGVEGGMGYWEHTGIELIAMLFYAAACHGYTLRHIFKWIKTQNLKAIKTALIRLPEGWRLKTEEEITRDRLPWPLTLEKGEPLPEEYVVGGKAYDSFQGFVTRQVKERQTVFSTAGTLLEVLLWDEAVACTTATTFDVEEFLSGNNTLYIISPPEDAQALVPFVCGLIMHVVRRVRDRDLKGQPIDKPLLLALDEAKNIAPLDDLSGIASNDRDRGIVLVTVWQAYSQLEALYEREAATIWANHPCKAFLGGISDPATLDMATKLFGKTVTLDIARSSADAGAETVSETPRETDLIPADQLRRLPEGKQIVVVERHNPIRCNQRLFFRDPKLQKLSRIPIVPGVAHVGAAPELPAWEPDPA
jgi:type IV secretory pathway TraG/TraD family ATPase VirD4